MNAPYFYSVYYASDSRGANSMFTYLHSTTPKNSSATSTIGSDGDTFRFLLVVFVKQHFIISDIAPSVDLFWPPF